MFWVDSWQLSGLQKTTNVLTSSFENSWISPIVYEEGNYVYNPQVGNLNNANHPAALIDTGSRAPQTEIYLMGHLLDSKNVISDIILIFSRKKYEYIFLVKIYLFELTIQVMI